VDNTALSREALQEQIASFLTGYSIEVTPHDADKLPELVSVLPAGTAVYVAHPPGVPIDAVVMFAAKLQSEGFKAVPHIIARKLETRAQLEQALAELERQSVDEALVIAGDMGVDNGPFDSSLEVLETGLFSRFGFTEVGVAGHPEGSKAIGEKRVAEALAGKVRFAAAADFRVRFVTQFGFDPKAFTDWEAATSAEGMDLPIHVGMAGPASLRQLAKFALMCGVGASARMLMTRAGATANLLRTHGPDDLVVHFARHRAAHPSCRIRKGHFFAFGGVVKTAKWANAVVAGRFDINAKADGFDVPKAALA
jgi:methylenetetrahydrofolate reductase (NADPH)